MTLRYVSLAFFTLLCFLVWTEFCDRQWSDLYHHYVPTCLANPNYFTSHARYFTVLVVLYNWFGGLWILLDWLFEVYNKDRDVPPLLDGTPSEASVQCEVQQ